MAKGHMSGNVFEERPDLTRDNYAALDFQRWLHEGSNYQYRGTLADWKVDAAPDLGANLPVTQSATAAQELVLAHAGASLHRDAVDIRVTENVRQRKGKLLDSQSEVGGWPALRSAPAPVDQDRDGMPDDWENAHGLNPDDASDASKPSKDGSGYSNIEIYLNTLAG